MKRKPEKVAITNQENNFLSSCEHRLLHRVLWKNILCIILTISSNMVNFPFDQTSIFVSKEINSVADLYSIIGLVEQKLLLVPSLTLLLLEKGENIDNKSPIKDGGLDYSDVSDYIKKEELEQLVTEVDAKVYEQDGAFYAGALVSTELSDNDDKDDFDDDSETVEIKKTKKPKKEKVPRKRVKKNGEEGGGEKNTSYAANKKPCLCVICGKVYASRHSLSCHKKSVHERVIKKYHCQFCNQDIEVYQFSKFFTHRQKCEMEVTGKCDRYVCPKCGDKSGTLIQFRKHKQVCYGVDAKVYPVRVYEYPCTYEGCTFKTKRKRKLANHINVDHLNIPIARDHSCEACGKAYATKSALRDHIMQHHTHEKPFQCVECGARFSNSGLLRQHKKIHSDELTYICPFCGKGFKQQSVLYRHKLNCPHRTT